MPIKETSNRMPSEAGIQVRSRAMVLRMTSHDECARNLRSFIDQGDRNDLGTAQNVILKYALGESDPQERADAMDALIVDLTHSREPATMSEAQRAFHS